MSVIGFDTETHRIRGQELLPPLVCASLCSHNDAAELFAACEAVCEEVIESVLTNDEVRLVGHNIAFDLGVLCTHNPDWIPLVFEKLSKGLVSCTIVREKLLHLTWHGDVAFAPLPGGETQKLEYGLDKLVYHYFGEDISAAKEGDDKWRMNFHELDGLEAGDYPQEAIDYAKGDAVWARRIWHAQEELRAERAQSSNIDPFTVESFRVACDFALTLMSAWGMRTDAAEFVRIRDWLKEEMTDEKLTHLLETGILRPEKKPRPYKNGATNEDGTPKMTQGKPASINKKLMQQMILELKEHRPDDVVVKMTPPSEKFPKGQVSFDAEWLEDHYHLTPWLEEYRHRQKLQKLVTTELPRMCLLDAEGNHTEEVAPVVHPCYDVLKNTGRTSSFASKTYPSFNCQNVDPRVRGCYVPRDGYLLLSQDYGGMELGTLAQTCLNLFGKSVLADKINAGVDAHAYLAASIAYNVDERFQEQCNEIGVANTDDIYECFMPMKAAEDEELRKFFKHYRKLAKPTGLGYPGGLGPATFITYAKSTFGLEIDKETAELLREVWFVVYPEMSDYFNYINTRCLDQRNSPRQFQVIDPKTGEKKTIEKDVYAYSTPMGLYRAACDYCAAANGLGLQSPSAEGALTAVFNVVRACYDVSLGSILLDDERGVRLRPICFIHDELVYEIRIDDQMQDWIDESERIMLESMSTITPDVTPKVESALMRRWDKRAEPCFNEEGRLTVWEISE